MRTFTYQQRVYFSDTDAQGIVYHAAYLNFAEHARTEFARTIGASGLMGGIAFVVRNINISYEKSAVLDDLLTVETTVTETGRVSMTLEQLIKREDELIARLTVKLACIDIRDKKLARIDDRLISQL